jgi:hypothetical protein
MRKLIAKDGQQIFKAVHLKIFFPGNKKAHRQTVRAPYGQAFNAEGIERLLRDAADQIEKKWPTEQYALVALGPSSFNFVWRNPVDALGDI